MEDQERLTEALADRYAIEREIGSGGMATVYLAHDLKHDRQVAVKVLDPDLTQSLGAERFLREIKTAANLAHPHILPLFDSGEADSFLFYVMPYVEGESLRSCLTKEKQLPVEDAVQITREIADALAYAHEKGVIHRDVKPANIMLEEGHAVLADFGVAQAVAQAGDERITQTGISLGTPTYMSPEQATGGGGLDGRTDQYALGCVLFEMLTGYPPFTGAEVEAVVRQHLTLEPPSVTEVRPSVSAEVEKVIDRALAKNPADRFRTTGEMAGALAVTAVPVQKVPVRLSPPWLIGLAVGVLAVVALMVWRPWAGDEGSVAAVGPPPFAILAEAEGSASEELREVVGSLLASGINGTNILQVLPQNQIRLGLERMMKPDTTRLTAEVAKELAERARIETVFLPTLDRVGSTYALTVQAQKVPGDTLLATVHGTAAGEDALINACNDVVGGLGERLAGTLGADRSRAVATLPMTSSMEAYRKYGSRGLTPRQRTQVLGEALRIDPEFARAWRSLGLLYDQLHMPDSADWARREALKYPERLTEYGRLRTQAVLTGDRLQVLQFEQRWYRQTGVPLSSLGLEFMFAGVWDEAVTIYEEIARQNPLGLTNFYNWAFALAMLGEMEEARELLPRLGSTKTETTIRGMIAQREADWNELERIATERLDDPTAEPGSRTEALLALASAQAARGRVNEAFLATRMGRRIALEEKMDVSIQTNGRFVLTLASESAAGDYGRNELPPEATEWDRVWEGLWAVEVGDTALARSYLAMLPEPELPEFGRPRALDALIVVLQARLAAKQGNWAEAVSQLGAVTGDRAPVVSNFSLEAPRNQLANWTLAEAQAQLGELEAAALTFAGVASGEHFGWHELWLSGLTYSFAHRRAALLYGQVGNREKAIEHWGAFLDAFTDPDPDFEWMVEEARVELARLEG